MRERCAKCGKTLSVYNHSGLCYCHEIDSEDYAEELKPCNLIGSITGRYAEQVQIKERGIMPWNE